MTTPAGQSADFGYGQMQPSDTASPYSALWFVVQQALGNLNGMKVVKVVAVANAGGDAAYGSVDVHPLVNQVDGAGNATPHGTVYGLPYIRLQGGTSAFIIDPKVGDIGVALIADRDISAVKATRAEATPGTRRRFSLSDGVYFGGILNGDPTQFVRATEEGISITSPTKITLSAPTVEVEGSLHTTGPVTGDGTAVYGGDVVGAGHSLSTHRHGQVQLGAFKTALPTTINNP